jgi:aubergine-like protein
MTQVVLKFTCKKMNLSVATNVMKQVNSKIGGESIRIRFPEFMNSQKVMIIGIDVCHSGRKSVVGFIATTNSNCTSFYSDIIIQQKGQELVKKDLDKCILNACNSFKSMNKGELPNKIIIYRDGVGEGMREQIMNKEVHQFKEALKPLYNSITSIPDVTLVVINKRIN